MTCGHRKKETLMSFERQILLQTRQNAVNLHTECTQYGCGHLQGIMIKREVIQSYEKKERKKERKKNKKQINNAYSLNCYVGENTSVKMHKY